MPDLSVLIPVYNEEQTLERLLDAVEERPEVSELVIVDDGSTDRTSEILKARDFKGNVQIIRHERNRGKGAALRTAIAAATGDVALVQDADLEYDPADFPRLLAPIERGEPRSSTAVAASLRTRRTRSGSSSETSSSRYGPTSSSTAICRTWRRATS